MTRVADLWASSTQQETEWRKDEVTYRDAYHCAGASCAANNKYKVAATYCGHAFPTRPCTGSPMENLGWYYVTISGRFVGAGETVFGDVTLEFAEPPSFIRSEQLAALKDMWLQTCWYNGRQRHTPVFDASAEQPN